MLWYNVDVGGYVEHRVAVEADNPQDAKDQGVAEFNRRNKNAEIIQIEHTLVVPEREV